MFARILNIQPGITSIIGSGGKTTLLETLGRELSALGHTVVLTTTTRIYPFDGIPFIPSPELRKDVLRKHRLICTGRPAENGKLGPPELSLAELAALADCVIAECDGSKGLPLKAHLDHEPVIPSQSSQTICVVGISGLYRPVFQTVHRPERFSQLAGLPLDAPVSPEAAARVLNGENLADRYLLNQAEVNRDAGICLQALLHKNAVTASLRSGEVFL